MTTYVNRKTARAALKTLFVSNGNWQAVYEATPNTFDRQTPVLVLRSGGTRQLMQYATDPATFRIEYRTYVLYEDPNAPDDYGDEECEDKLDDLDKEMREVVRDNTPSGADAIELGEGFTETGYEMVDGVVYRWEEGVILVQLAVGVA